MAFREIEIYPSKFMYRCDDCGFEFPMTPVVREKLGTPPAHDCPTAHRTTLHAILDDEENKPS